MFIKKAFPLKFRNIKAKWHISIIEAYHHKKNDVYHMAIDWLIFTIFQLFKYVAIDSGQFGTVSKYLRGYSAHYADAQINHPPIP